MIIDVVMPKMGESITEGTILEWRKNVGEWIEMDEILLEIGTDKVDSEIPSSNQGIITEILAQPNDVVEVGKTIARIDTESKAGVTKKLESTSEPAQETLSHTKAETHPPDQGDKSNKMEDNETPIVSINQPISVRKFYTPVVKAIARKEKISKEELASLSGTGHNNRVTKNDLLTYIEQRTSQSVTMRSKVDVEKDISVIPKPSNDVVITSLKDDRVEMNKMRRMIAEHMRHSLDTSAHVHLMNEVDMTHIVRFVRDHGDGFQKSEGFSLTYTPFIMAACVRVLQSFPEMNSSIEGSTIIRKKNINIGLAVSVDNGLMVPVIPKCEEMNFLGLCRKIRDLASRARTKQIKPDELSGSTFSISNFGVFNVTMGTPIINQPNVGILGVGTIKKKPVVIETDEGDAIGIRSMMHLSLGFDHRLIDGSGGARFIEMVLNQLENMDLKRLF